MLKKCMCLLIALIIVVSCVPVVSGAYAEELQVESITVEPLSIIEGTGGYWKYDYGLEEYYYYYDFFDVKRDIKFVVTLTDGTVLHGKDNELEYNGETYYMSFASNQSGETPWLAGNTYEAEIIFMNQFTKFDVTIEPSPVKSIDIKPVSLIENTHGFIDTDSDTGKEYYKYRNFFNGAEYTVTMKDGSVITSTEDYLIYNGKPCPLEVTTDQSYENQWTTGNTYKATAHVMGVSTEFSVFIEPYPIKNIEVKPLTIREGTRGVLDVDESGELYFQYAHYCECIECLLTFNDDTVVECKGNWFDYNGETYYIYIEDNQSDENRWEGGNTYEAKAIVGDVSVTFPVTILETTIESIEIDPVAIIENTKGSWENCYDYDSQSEVQYYYYYDWHYDIDYTVTFKDGTVETGVGSTVAFQYPIYIYDDQFYENRWTVGNTYEVTAMVSGVYTTFPVTIVESPIKKLEIEPVTIIENTNGYLASKPDATTGAHINEYFCYNLDEFNYTLTLKDGTIIKGTGTDVDIEGLKGVINTESTQSFENQWKAGNTYEGVASITGVRTTFPVTIVASPIKSLEIESICILEGTNGTIACVTDTIGEYTLEYFEYFPQSLMEYTVTFADGAIVSGVGETFEHNGTEYEIFTNYYQSYDNQWTAGNTYEVYAELLGVSTTFLVAIEEFPIKEIDFEPIYISEDDNTDRVHFISKDEETGKYKEVLTFWHTNNPKYTITFADGTVMQSGGEYIKYRNVSHMFVPYFDRAIWTTGGVYDSTATLMGGEVPIKVFYDKARLWGINLAKEPDKTVFEKHECVNPEGAVINVKYSYDTYESVTLGRYNPISSDNNYEYIKGLDNEFSVYVTGKGEYMEMNNRCLISFAGYPEYISAKYKDREVTGVSIREENSGLYMTFAYDDGSDQNLKVLGMEIVDKTVKDSTDKRRGLVITNDGNFIGEFFRNTETGEFYIVMDGVDGAALTSNTLSSCKWWDMQSRYDDIVRAINVYVHNTKSFKGDITSENIDELLSVACNVSGLYDSIDNVCSVTSEGVEFKADLVKSTFFDLFGVMPDLELSKKYDAEKGTVKVRAMGTAESCYEVPYNIKESNGTFTATVLWGSSEYKMTLDENLKLVAYGVGENKENTDTTEPPKPVTPPDSSEPSDVEKPSDSTKPSETEIPSDSENTTDTISLLGDVNGDGKVNIKDATMIQKAAAKIIELTDDKKLRADVNTDSKNNVKDATAIQKFVAKIETGFPIGEPIVSKENN